MKMKRYIRRMGVAVVMLLLAHGSALAQSTLKNLVEHATVKWYVDQQKSTELTTVTLTSSTQTLYLEITPADGWWTNADLLGGQVRLIGKNSAADARRRSGETTGPVIGSPMAVTAVSGQTYHKYGGGLYQVILPALTSDQSADQIARLELTGQMTKCRTITPAVVNTTMTVKIDDGAVTYAKPGEKIDVTIASAVNGYQFNHFTVTYLDGTTQQPVEVTTLSVESRSFTMPDGDVTIDASYIAPRPYAVKNEAGDVLTFYFGGIATTGYDSNNSTWRTSENSGWGEIKTTLKTVVIDPKMANCTSLTSLAYWFSGCTNLTEIQGLAYLKTENVTDMSHLFEGCEGFTKLYLTTFDTRKVTDMTAMFKGCTNLKRIFVDTNWSADLVTSSTDMFTGCTNIKGRKGTAYDAAHTDAGYAHVDAVDNPGYLMPNAQLYALYTSSDRTLTFYYDGETRSGVRTEGDAFKNGVKESYQDGYDKFGWGGDMKTVVFDESMADCDEITSMSWWFANYTSIQAVKGLEYLVMDNVTDIKYAFWYSTGLKEFDFSKFNTKNVKVMYNSFYRIGMPEVDFTEFDTSSVEDMRGICGWSGALKKITVGGKFDTRKFTTPANDLSEFRGVGCDIVQVKDASNHHISANIFQEMADRTTRRLETDSPLPEGELTFKDGFFWWKGAKFASFNKFRSLKIGTPENGSVALTTATTYEGYGEEGQTLTFKATPNIGYELASIILTYNDGTSKTVTGSDTDDENIKTLIMPGYEATVTANFQPIMKTLDPTKPCSKDNPYAIRTVEDMRNLSVWANAGAPFTSGAWFKVVTENAVFDFEGVDDFEGIGCENHTFTSNFDGNGLTIKNLHITGTSRVGLFGDLNGNVSNIRIDGSCSVTATGWYIGAIAGTTRSNTITNCHNDGANVSGQAFVGGLVGDDYYSNVSLIDCSVGMTMAEGTKMYISGKDSIAAMVGDARGTMRNNWYNGMTVVVKKTDGREYTGFGYARGEILGDFEGLKSATGGYFPAVTPGHTKQTISWSYNLYNKTITIAGDADDGYNLIGVTISYVDAEGEPQTISRNEAQLKESRSFEVPYHPTACTATLYGVLRPADMTKDISQTNPYLIHNVQDMVTLTKYTKAGIPWTSGSWFKVADENAVFDFEGVEDFEPIGCDNHTFTSNFDGNGLTIKNLHITGTSRVGLFGDLNGNVSNIRIDGSCSVTATGWYVGAIAGTTRSNTITNCHNDGANVSGQAFVGGLVGDDYYSNVNLIDCSVGMKMAEGTKMYISGKDSIAAMVGDARGTMRNNWYNGMTVVVKKTDGREYTGFGYARGEIFGDFNGLSSATGGYFPVIPGNTDKSMMWTYNLYTDSLKISGTPERGYDLMSVTVKCIDKAGAEQTIVLSDKLATTWTHHLPGFPRSITAAYATMFTLLDATKPNSKSNPYLIRSVDEMKDLSKWVNAGVSYTRGAYFKVMPENAVFDFAGVDDFIPIGTMPTEEGGSPFTGNFDGNGVTIKNLTLVGTDNVGLFGYTNSSSCEIRNVDMEACQVRGERHVGMLVGYATGGTKIINNQVGMSMPAGETMTVTGDDGVGVIVGYAENCTFSNNVYDGMDAYVKVHGREYKGHAIGCGLSDPNGVSTRSGGYFTDAEGKQLQRLSWRYNKHTELFEIVGGQGLTLTSATVTYKNEAGQQLTVSKSQEELATSKSFTIEGYPTVTTAAYTYGKLSLLYPSIPCRKENPYLIRSVDDMCLLSAAVANREEWTIKSYFKVAEENAVFDFADVYNYVPIGPTNAGIGTEQYSRLDGCAFHSSFDGNGVTIKNLHVVTNDGFVGLFGDVSADSQDEAIENITIDSSCMFVHSNSIRSGSLTSLSGCAGSVVAAINFVTVRNCKNLGAPVYGGFCVGGIVGHSRYATIENCSNNANVTGHTSVGGIVGYIDRPVTLKDNRVGFGMPEGAKILIQAEATGGAVYAYNFRAATLINNVYNGLTVTLKVGDKVYHTSGYGRGTPLNDVNGAHAALEGYCGVTTENGGKNVRWVYNPTSHDLRIIGTGQMRDDIDDTEDGLLRNNVTSLTICEGVTSIGQQAFKDWEKLKTVSFDGCILTSVADNAFEGCSAMAGGVVNVRRHSPMTADMAAALFCVITNGSLVTDESINLTSELVSTDDGKYKWHGGTFATYQRVQTTLEFVIFGDEQHWATYYTVENMTIPEGLTAYVVDSFDNGELKLSMIDYIPAAVGVLLYSEEAGSGYIINGYSGATKTYNSLLVGSLSETALNEGCGYVLFNDEFVKVTDGVIPAKRCYLPVADGNVAPARLRITNSGSTGVREVESYDNENGTWYDLNGRKLDGTPKRKGIYIRNGRKTVVK